MLQCKAVPIQIWNEEDIFGTSELRRKFGIFGTWEEDGQIFGEKRFGSAPFKLDLKVALPIKDMNYLQLLNGSFCELWFNTLTFDIWLQNWSLIKNIWSTALSLSLYVYLSHANKKLKETKKQKHIRVLKRNVKTRHA